MPPPSLPLPLPLTPFLAATTKPSQPIYGKALFKYKGFPKPPSALKPVLIFDQDEIIQLTDIDDDEWWRGWKLRFNGSPVDTSLYKEDGYFPRSYVKNIDQLTELGYYSWYLPGCERDLAIKILYRIMPYNSLKTLFMVRSRSKKDTGYAISFAYKNKIFHIKINETFFSPGELKPNETGGFLAYSAASITNQVCLYFA